MSDHKTKFEKARAEFVKSWDFYGHVQEPMEEAANWAREYAFQEVAELVVAAERALRLSKEHPDFKLYAMEPFTTALAKLKGKDYSL